MGIQSLPTFVLIGAILLVGAAIGFLTGISPLSHGGDASGIGANSTDANAYRSSVIGVLQGEAIDRPTPRLEPGLVPALSALFDAMYCPANDCRLASEMAYLLQVNGDMRSMMRNDLLNPICRSDDLTPPTDALRRDRETICTRLNNVMTELDALHQNAETARSLLARNEDPSQFSSVLDELNRRMMGNREAIVAELRSLRDSTHWLRPVFDGAQQRIPGLAESAPE